MLLPVIAVLMVCVAFGRFICLCSSALLSLISGILFMTSLFVFATDVFADGMSMLVLAFLVSPLGIPMVAVWLVEKLDDARWLPRSI